MSKKQKVTLTNAQINISELWLNQIAGGVIDWNLGYYVARNLRPLVDISNDYKEAHRCALKRTGAKIENGEFVTVEGKYQFDTPDNEQASIAALTELANIENEVEFYPVKLSKIQKGSSLSKGAIVPVIFALDWMIVFDLDDDEMDEIVESVDDEG